MKFLVTGATSGLGRNAAEELAGLGHALRATGRNLRAGKALRDAGIEFEPADLTAASDAELTHLVRDVDSVWHCAALSSPWGRPSDFEAANVDATRRLALAAVARKVSCFIHVSTPSIYFDYRHHTRIPETYRPARFANAYAASKARAETVITDLADRHPSTRFVILRPRAIFGPHDRVILPRLLALLRRRRGLLPLPDGGRAHMDFTYVGNVVQAMMLATAAPGLVSGEAFNVTNQQPCSLAELLHSLLGRHWGLPYAIRAVPYALLAPMACALELFGHVRGREPVFTRYSVGALHFGMTLDNSRAQNSLRYFPRVDMEEAVRRTAHWHRQYGTHHAV